MEKITEQVTDLCNIWQRTYNIASAAPSSWQPYLQSTSLEILNEPYVRLFNLPKAQC